MKSVFDFSLFKQLRFCIFNMSTLLVFVWWVFFFIWVCFTLWLILQNLAIWFEPSKNKGWIHKINAKGRIIPKGRIIIPLRDFSLSTSSNLVFQSIKSIYSHFFYSTFATKPSGRKFELQKDRIHNVDWLEDPIQSDRIQKKNFQWPKSWIFLINPAYRFSILEFGLKIEIRNHWRSIDRFEIIESIISNSKF